MAAASGCDDAQGSNDHSHMAPMEHQKHRADPEQGDDAGRHRLHKEAKLHEDGHLPHGLNDPAGLPGHWFGASSAAPH